MVLGNKIDVDNGNSRVVRHGWLGKETAQGSAP